MAAPEPADWQRAQARAVLLGDQDVLRILREAYRGVNRDLQLLARNRSTSAAIRRDQLLAIKRRILEDQAVVFERIGNAVQVRRVQAAARAIRLTGAVEAAAFAAANREEDARRLTAGLLEGNERGLDAVMARMTGSAQPLSRRVYRSQAWTRDLLERRINSALARNLSAQDFAREVRDLVNPNTPGGQRYAALRLARTEINNAFHAMAIEAARQRPWINKLEWHTSRSHSHKDVCDRLNGRLFTPEECPPKPHPQCFCYITPVVDDEDDLIDALVNGEYDDIIGTPD